MNKILPLFFILFTICISAQTSQEGKLSGPESISSAGNSVILISTDKQNIKDFTLKQNYPNPFNPETLIEFSIPQSSFVSLKVYNLLGKEVANLVNDSKDAGVYQVKFDGGNLSSGIYFYTLRSGNKIITKKFILTK